MLKKREWKQTDILGFIMELQCESRDKVLFLFRGYHG